MHNMKKFKSFIVESTDPHLTKTEFDNGKKRFYSGDIGYFAIGAKVKTREAYSGVTEGKIKHIMPHPIGKDHPYMYRIEHTLPKDHPEATDENGEPEYKKTQIMKGEDLTKLNPEHEWDGK